MIRLYFFGILQQVENRIWTAPHLSKFNGFGIWVGIILRKVCTLMQAEGAGGGYCLF